LFLSLLLPACPGDDGNTTDAAASTGTTTETPTSGQPSTSGSTGPGNSSDPDSTSSAETTSSPGTTAADSTTTGGGPTIACEDATTDVECAAAGSMETSCGWFRIRHFVVGDMCEQVAEGGLCLPTSQGDDSCGIFREPSCQDTDVVVYVRPSMEVDGAIETLQLGTSDACTGPDPGDGWELCVPAMMMAGCRCGCS
jgi:hypothetical protein